MWRENGATWILLGLLFPRVIPFELQNYSSCNNTFCNAINSLHLRKEIIYKNCSKFVECRTGNRRVFPQIYPQLRFKNYRTTIGDWKRQGKSVPLHPLPRFQLSGSDFSSLFTPGYEGTIFPPSSSTVFTLDTWFPYLTSVHIRIIQGGFLKIDEKAGAPGKTRLYPDLASGIHDAPSRMGGGWISGWRDPTRRGRVEKRISRGKTRARREFTAIRIYRDGNGRAQYRSTDGNRSLERPESGGRCG